ETTSPSIRSGNTAYAHEEKLGRGAPSSAFSTLSSLQAAPTKIENPYFHVVGRNRPDIPDRYLSFLGSLESQSNDHPALCSMLGVRRLVGLGLDHREGTPSGRT